MTQPLKTLHRRLLAALLLVPAALLGSAGMAQAQDIDLLVNHDVVPVSAEGPAGGEYSYVPIVVLNGGAQATGVTLTEILPIGVTLNGIDFNPVGSNTCDANTFPVEITAANQTITCSLDDITAPGEGNGITASFNVTIPTPNTNWLATASASSSENDPNPGNNVGIERNITTTAGADLGIALNGPGGTITQFTPFDYEAVVTNHGPSQLPGNAQVTFTVPSGTSVSGTSGTGWSCSPASGNAGTLLTCTHAGPVDPGVTLDSLFFTTTATSSGEIDAAASVSGFEPDGSTPFPDAVDSNNTAELGLTIDADTVVDVGIAKTVSPATVDQSLATNPVTYTITPSRLGGAQAPTNVQVTDTLPNGVTITGALPDGSNGWTCTQAGSTITCDYSGSAPSVGGDYPAITLQANVDGTAAPASATNTANVSASNEAAGATGNNSDTATVTVSNTVSLTLNKSASQSPIEQGKPFSFDLRVTNNGDLDVQPGQTITLVDTIPAGLEVTGFSGAGWACTPATATGPAVITCTNNAGLTHGSSTTVTLAAVGTFSGAGTFVPLTNTVDLTGVTGREPITLSDSATVNVSEHEVDLSIAKQASPASVKSGDEVTYTITVTNEDAANASTGIRVTDVLGNLVTSKDGCTYDANGVCQGDGPWPGGGLGAMTVTGGTGGSCSANGDQDSRSRTVTCTIDELAAGATATIEVKARHFAEDGAQSEVVQNTAEVRSTQVDSDGPKTSNTTQVTVSPIADLQVFKVPSPDPAAVGEPVTYTVHVRNAGPSYAANVNLKDVLPANAHWIAGSLSASGTCYDEASTDPIADDAMGATLGCDWTSTAGNLSTQLAPNAQYAVTYKLRSAREAQADDELFNPVDVTTTTEETTTANNHDEATVTLKRAELDVLINMQHDNDALVVTDHEQTEYTITVTNNGPSYATDVTMTDLFPGELVLGGETFPSSATFSWKNNMTVVSNQRGDIGDSVCAQPAVDATGGPLACVFDKMAPGETMTIKFTMAAEALPPGAEVGTIFHNAKVELFEEEWLADGSDVLANNTTTDRTSARLNQDTAAPEVADLGIVKDADASVDLDSDPLEPGDALTYTLTVTNHGPAQSTLGQVSDVLPAGLDFVSATGGCTFDPATRALQCGVGTLDPGADVVFVISTTVEDDYRGPTQLTNVARVSAPGDPNPGNNQDDVKTRVKSLAAVPTLTEWALILMMLLMGGLGAMRLRRARSGRHLR